MGGRTPETCWAVNKRQDNELENCCSWLVIYLNCTMMHGLTNLKFVKTKVTPQQIMKAQRANRRIALFLNSTIEGWGVSATPRPLYLREWFGAHYAGGWVGPRGFDLRTVHPLASPYTDYAIPAHLTRTRLNCCYVWLCLQQVYMPCSFFVYSVITCSAFITHESSRAVGLLRP